MALHLAVRVAAVAVVGVHAVGRVLYQVWR